MPDARGRSQSTAADDVAGGDVQVAATHWLSLSVFSQSQVRINDDGLSCTELHFL